MTLHTGKILIIDEVGFSRVCAAILEIEGYKADAAINLQDFTQALNNGEIRLIITSYPYGKFFLEDLKTTKIPIILLSDHISNDLIKHLEGFERSFCMIKPLDYQKFKSIVSEFVYGTNHFQGGLNIV